MRQYNINGMCVYVRPVKRDVEEDVDDDSLKSRSRKKPWLSVSEKDTVLALATVENGVPHVRNVNAYYENGAFYIITYALSGKMRHIESNPRVAVAGEWFTGHGTGDQSGTLGEKENHQIAVAFAKSMR